MKSMKFFILLIMIILALFMIGCIQDTKPEKELSELQLQACDTAHEAGTCDSRLPEVGIVLKEECCEVIGKCC